MISLNMRCHHQYAHHQRVINHLHTATIAKFLHGILTAAATNAHNRFVLPVTSFLKVLKLITNGAHNSQMPLNATALIKIQDQDAQWNGQTNASHHLNKRLTYHNAVTVKHTGSQRAAILFAHQLDIANGLINQLITQIINHLKQISKLLHNAINHKMKLPAECTLIVNGMTTQPTHQRCSSNIHSATQLMLIALPLLPTGKLVSLTITQLAQNQLVNVLMILD